MTWRDDVRHRCFTTSKEGWRLLAQQPRTKRTWRAGVAPSLSGLAQIAPVCFSRTATRAWRRCARSSTKERYDRDRDADPPADGNGDR
jgi:hypothetical protein